MSTPHNEANLGDFAKTVIMPGDPKRAELIAKNYLTDSKLVNDVRGMKAYTGFYNGKKVSVMASGMGIPSMGIYSYELYKYYDTKYNKIAIHLYIEHMLHHFHYTDDYLLSEDIYQQLLIYFLF